MKKQGYDKGQSDHTMFVKHSGDGKITILIVYVDDIILTGDDEIKIARLKRGLVEEFEIKDLGQLRYFLRMKVTISKKAIVVSQRKYVMDLLQETGMSSCKPSDTLMDPNKNLGEKTGVVSVDVGRYQQLVGKLIYVSYTRLDIVFVVSFVSQFMHSPCKEHLEAVYHILRYLKGTPGKGLYFKKNVQRNLEVYIDIDWACSITNRRSTLGYCTFPEGNLVIWRNKKQKVVA